ncbi:hypothetical protein [Streptomyces sp. NPDC054838]
MTDQDDLGRAVAKLRASRSKHRPVLAFEAVQKVLDEVDKLEAVPGVVPASHPLTVALRELRAIRVDPDCRRDAVLDRKLEAVGAAYARQQEMLNQPGSKRIMQLTKVVHNETGRLPGAAEQAAFKAWTDYYEAGSKIIHPGVEATAEMAVGLLHDVLTVIRELVFTLTDQASEWVALASVTSPTAEQVRQVNMLHHPSAAPFLFSEFSGWDWLEKLELVRLLPEADRWPAAPYLQKLASEDPARLAGWLEENKRLDAIYKNGAEAAGRLMWLCRYLAEHAIAIITRTLKEYPTETVRLQSLYWAQDVGPAQRETRWVDVVVKALSARPECPFDSWVIRSTLVQLIDAGRRTGGSQVTSRVRSGLVAVLAAYLAGDGVRERLQIGDDLRSPSLAGSREMTGAWLAAQACLEFARAELEAGGVDLHRRTGAWTVKALGGWERERLLSVHLGEAAVAGVQDPSWWTAAFDVLARLNAMPMFTADVGEFFQVVIGTRGPDEEADLVQALLAGFGPAPGPDALQAAQAEFADEDARLARTLAAVLGEETKWQSAIPNVWRTVWCLSKVLPAAVLETWRPVVDLMTEYGGEPSALTEPRFKVVPWPDRGATAASDFVALCAERGVLPGATHLSAAIPTQGSYFERTEFKMLEDAVRAAPDAWAADIRGVSSALATFDLRTVYLGELLKNDQAAGLTDPGGPRLSAAITAAWDLMTSLRECRGSTDSDLDECARRAMGQLLHKAWALGTATDINETAVIPWLEAMVRNWTEPTSAPDNPHHAATATSGGCALVALLQWAVRRAADDGAVPIGAATLLTELVVDGRDDRALAAIGSALTPLRRHAFPWYTTYRETLLDITTATAPVHTWLRGWRLPGPEDYAVLGDIEPDKVEQYLRTDAPDWAFSRFAFTLLHSPDTLGPDFLRSVIANDGGPRAASAILSDVARALPQKPETICLNERGLHLWDQVLHLVDEDPVWAPALEGAGHFAFAEGIDPAQWLPRALRTVMATASIEYADRTASRAARTPQAPEALRILTKLVALAGRSGSQDDYRVQAVIRHAQDAVDASEPGSEGRAELGQALGSYAHDVGRATAQ